MRLSWAALAVFLYAPARAALVEGPAPVEAPQIPALPTPAAPVLQQNFTVTQSLGLSAQLSAGLITADLAAQAAPNAQTAAAGAAATPTRGQSARSEVSALVGGFTREGGAQAALPAVFDGNFTKGSIEDRLVAPMPGRDGNIDLSRIPTAPVDPPTRKKAEKKLEKDREKLDVYGQKIWADKKNKILFVLQGMDTGGKDGIIKHVLKGMLPQVFKITGFKKPTEEEASHRFLWRIKNALGAPGQITVFNRSHYEDALVPMAKKTMTPQQIDERIAQINAFEKELTEQGWTIVKVFLHVSKEKNWERLDERRTNKRKRWKLSQDDIVSRANWDANQGAYEYVIARTNTSYAPWFIVPADKKWYRNYAVGRLYKRALKRLRPKWPKPKDLPKRIPKFDRR